MVRLNDVTTKRVQQVRGFEIVFVGSSIFGLLVVRELLGGRFALNAQFTLLKNFPDRQSNLRI